MKKDEVIELLKEQIKELRDDNNRLLDQIDDLIKEVSSLKEALLQKRRISWQATASYQGDRQTCIKHIRTATTPSTCIAGGRAAEERSRKSR
jgi:cell division septum initiation protein DivIVA